jgi:hypothetical protein
LERADKPLGHEHERQLPRAARRGAQRSHRGSVWHRAAPLCELLRRGGSNGHDELEVDKAWHGLHFLLTGTAWDGDFPLNFIVVGGEEVGEDLGYGPARALRSEDVRKIDSALEPFTSDELGRRFDAERMTELQIYPFGWSHDPEGELEYLLEFYGELRAFLRRTAEQGHALLVYLS